MEEELKGEKGGKVRETKTRKHIRKEEKINKTYELVKKIDNKNKDWQENMERKKKKQGGKVREMRIR